MVEGPYKVVRCSLACAVGTARRILQLLREELCAIGQMLNPAGCLCAEGRLHPLRAAHLQRAVHLVRRDMIEPVTQEELEVMKDVHAIIVDREWFQIYDNNNKFTEDYVAAGMYWNYFYNVWKTVSYSPFSNIVAFTSFNMTEPTPNEIYIDISGIEDYDKGKIYTFEEFDGIFNVHHIQTEALTKKGVAVHPYGAYIVPDGAFTDNIPIAVEAKYNDKITNYTGAITLNPIPTAGTQITLTKQV